MGKGILGKIKGILGKKSDENVNLANEDTTCGEFMSISESLNDLAAPQFRTDDERLKAMMQAQANIELPASGTEGDIRWCISEDQVLTISPTDSAQVARMANYCNPLIADPDMSPNAIAPWLQDKKGIVVNKLVLEEGIVNIGSNAFATCEFLEDVQLPSSLTAIGDAAFSDCTSLKTIALPTGITAIPTLAFWRCRSLSEVILPNTLERIDNLAFAECNALESIHIPEGTAHIGESAFWGCPLFKSIDDFIEEAKNEEYADDDDDDNGNDDSAPALDADTAVAGCATVLNDDHDNSADDDSDGDDDDDSVYLSDDSTADRGTGM